MLLAARVVPTTVTASSSTLACPIVSQFERDLEQITAAEALLAFAEGPNATSLSPPVDTVRRPRITK